MNKSEIIKNLKKIEEIMKRLNISYLNMDLTRKQESVNKNLHKVSVIPSKPNLTPKSIENLIQKYLHNQTTRKEEKTLLNFVLKGISLKKYNQRKMSKED